ncbi:MAG: PAS domain S-box protein [Dehalococcoidales bacterium]|nr:PAS domain S-box protein [Dehalococcoidales bacterium]
MTQDYFDSPFTGRIIDGLSNPVFLIDKTHTVIYWNKAMENLSGISKEEIVGTKDTWRAFYKGQRPTLADIIVDEIDPQKINSFYVGTCEKSRVIEGALEANNYVNDIRGNVKWLHLTASPVRDDAGQIIGAIESLEDLSVRKTVEDALYQSEKSYRVLFESAYDAIWVHDMNGVILAANEALSALCGYPVKEMIGMNVKDFICGENDIEAAREVKAKLLDGGRIDAPYEMTLQRKDGTKLLTIVTTNMVNVANDSKAFQNTARDVTREKRMEENLRYYLKQITRAQEEERKRIARELHDDTAQLLLSLSRQIDNFLRKEPELKDIQLAFLKAVKEQLNDGVQAVNRYAQDLRPSLIDDLGLMAALRSYAARAREYDDMIINLGVYGKERRLPSEVEMLLYRVIQEALNNVWKHAEATQIQLDIHFEEKQVIVQIEDNGKGFDTTNIMDDVPQVGKLGLIGMHERAKLLGGVLEFNSKPGKGTRVKFSIPY